MSSRLNTKGGEKDLNHVPKQRDRAQEDNQQVRTGKGAHGNVGKGEEEVQRRWKAYLKRAIERRKLQREKGGRDSSFWH